ncbi:MAG TPA: EamA family transporter [Holophagaceae bacterium]|jgi:drug/metabolite transporter (DMT)-like permease|nr:EamA family transporter [Holophagaceae bacterium]
MLAWIAYATVALVWGSTYFAMALGIQAFTPYGMMAWRFTAGAVLALLIGRLQGEPLPTRKNLPHLALVGAFLLAGANSLVACSETRVSSGVAAILSALVPLGLALWDRERLSGRTWMGLALGLAGVGILTNPLEGAVDLGGVAILLLAVALWSYGTIHGKRHVRGGGMMTNVGVEMLAAALLCHVIALATGGYTHAPLTTKAVSALAYLVVFGSVVGFTAYVYIAKVWSPAKMGTYAYLNPLVAVLLGCAFLKEPFNGRMALGMAVVLAGVAIVQLRPALRLGSEEAA